MTFPSAQNIVIIHYCRHSHLIHRFITQSSLFPHDANEMQTALLIHKGPVNLKSIFNHFFSSLRFNQKFYEKYYRYQIKLQTSITYMIFYTIRDATCILQQDKRMGTFDKDLPLFNF